MHDRGYDSTVNVAGKTNGVAALMQTNNQKSCVNSRIPCASEVVELCLYVPYYDFISCSSGELCFPIVAASRNKCITGRDELIVVVTQQRGSNN